MGINTQSSVFHRVVRDQPDQVLGSASYLTRHRKEGFVEHLLCASKSVFVVVSCSSRRISYEVPSRKYADLSWPPTIFMWHGYASGLIYFYGVCIGEEDCIKVPVICNPKTGRYATLPYLRRYRKAYSFFGFDPIDKQFKVLFMAYPSGPDSHKIMTLGTGEMRWRRIKCSLRHEIVSEGICINGVLYYLGDTSGWGNGKKSGCVIVCFDVRSETFKWIYLESFCELINYKGKLGVIYLEDDDVDSKEDEVDANAIGLRVWVLEDLEKDEWSKYEYTLRDDKFISDDVSLVVVGVTATGEIILSMRRYVLEEPFYVFYFNPETKTLQSVEIKGFGAIDEGFASLSVYPFVNHVEDLNVNDAKLLKQSIYAPYVNTEVK